MGREWEITFPTFCIYCKKDIQKNINRHPLNVPHTHTHICKEVHGDCYCLASPWQIGHYCGCGMRTLNAKHYSYLWGQKSLLSNPPVYVIQCNTSFLKEGISDVVQEKNAGLKGSVCFKRTVCSVLNGNIWRLEEKPAFIKRKEARSIVQMWITVHTKSDSS